MTPAWAVSGWTGDQMEDMKERIVTTESALPLSHDQLANINHDTSVIYEIYAQWNYTESNQSVIIANQWVAPLGIPTFQKELPNVRWKDTVCAIPVTTHSQTSTHCKELKVYPYFSESNLYTIVCAVYMGEMGTQGKVQDLTHADGQ